jgi:hypothetical protein
MRKKRMNLGFSSVGGVDETKMRMQTKSPLLLSLSSV